MNSDSAARRTPIGGLRRWRRTQACWRLIPSCCCRRPRRRITTMHGRPVFGKRVRPMASGTRWGIADRRPSGPHPLRRCRRLTWRTADRSVPFGTKMRKNQIGIRRLSPVPFRSLTPPPEDSSGSTERNRSPGSPRREPREWGSRCNRRGFPQLALRASKHVLFDGLFC